MKDMLHIHGLGHFHPDNAIDNAFFEALDIGTTDEWILERVGIRSRRTVLSLDYIRQTRNQDPRAAREASGYTDGETGALAARVAMERAGVAADDIKMVIAGGCSPEYSIPAQACLVAAELGVEAPCIDIASACSTFAAQLHVLVKMGVGEGLDPVLLVQPENNTRAVDYNDRKTAVLWGDGSAAAVVSRQAGGRAQVVDTVLSSDPAGWDKVRIPLGGHFQQDGRAVQGFAIRKTTAVLQELRERASCPPEELIFIGHQANLLVLEGVCRRADVPDDRHFSNVEAFGNCGAAGAPSVLSQHWDSIGAAQEVAVSVVGSGLTWGGALLRFGGS